MWVGLKRVWTWVVDHWYVPIFVLGALVGFFLSPRMRRRGTPVQQTRTELRAIKATARARELQAELGAERAYAEIKREYDEAIQKLTLVQKAEAAQLRDDPVALARFLVRAGSR